MRKIIVFAALLLASGFCQSQELTPDELRDLLNDSIIVDLQTLIEMDGADVHVINLTNKIAALIRSYETTKQAQLKVIFRLKEILDKNEIPVTYR